MIGSRIPTRRLARQISTYGRVVGDAGLASGLLWILFVARMPIGYADKLIEVVLIVLLLVEARRSR